MWCCLSGDKQGKDTDSYYLPISTLNFERARFPDQLGNTYNIGGNWYFDGADWNEMTWQAYKKQQLLKAFPIIPHPLSMSVEGFVIRMWSYYKTAWNKMIKNW